MPEMPTSAFGALATTVPSASRTTMSRKRREVRPFSSRSICVPPTVTVCLPPKFFSIAAFSHGVAMSSSIGPLASRHHRPAMATTTTAKPSVALQNSPPHPSLAQKSDRAAAQPVPPPAAGTVRGAMMLMVSRHDDHDAADGPRPPRGGLDAGAYGRGRSVSCPMGRPSSGALRVFCRRPGHRPARLVAVIRGTACAPPTQLAIPTLTGRKRRKEGIWDANLSRDRRRRRSPCSATAERRCR